MTIRIANMMPGVSQKTGRRFLRGRDKFGNIWWVMGKQTATGMRWELRVDFSGSIAEPVGPALQASETDLRRIFASGSGPLLIEGEIEG